MPIWKFTTKMKRNCNGVFIEKGMTVEVVTSTTSNPLNNPQGRDQIAAAFMSKYGGGHEESPKSIKWLS